MSRKICYEVSRATQGMIFDGVKVEDGEGYGIVISADCDIENGKIDSCHYITLYQVKNFICNFLCNNIIQKKIDTWCNEKKLHLGFIHDCIKYKSLDINMFLSDKKADEKINFCFNKKFNPLFSCVECLINRYYRSELNSIIDSIINDRTYAYYYIGEIGDNNSGAIANFLDIRSLPINMIKSIPNGVRPSKKEIERHSLYEPCKIISPVGRLCSPQREHFMQRFAQQFVRIGLEDHKKTIVNDIIATLGV